MTTTTFILILIGAGVVALAGIIVVAARRSESEGAATPAELDRKAVKADRARRARLAEAQAEGGNGGGVATMVAAPAEFDDDPPKQEISSEEYGVTRRKFFNRALTAVFGLFMLQFTLASLAFMWPKLKGGFGTPINAGKVSDLKAEVLVAGSLVPKFVPPAQAWIVPFEMSKLKGSSFESVPFVVAGVNRTVSVSWRCGNAASTLGVGFLHVSHPRVSNVRVMDPNTTVTESIHRTCPTKSRPLWRVGQRRWRTDRRDRQHRPNLSVQALHDPVSPRALLCLMARRFTH